MRSTTTPRGYPPGYAIERVFSGLLHPYEEIAWETADVEIPGSGFRQEAVEAPATWDETARRIAASKYLRGQLGSPERERSVRQLVDRVVETIRHHGQKLGHLGSADEAEVFAQELRALLIGQRAAFNSPVWFNCGTDSGRRPADPDALLEPDEPPVAPGEPAVGQSAACFILSVRDTMESITRWLATEMAIFRGGSGSGVSLSAIREDGSPLKAGGTASGPLSFMRAADSAAGSIKSGGTTRRAAKMVVLDADHPDVRTFIAAKAAEERKAYALGDAGYDLSLNGEAWSSIQFQNANNSVRVPDEFFAAVADGRTWQLRSRLDGRVVDELPARDLLRQIATAAWECGDPGLQYDGAIQRWHTVPAAGRVNATNPCSEFIHLDETACNLASLNLLAFLGADGTFDVAGFRQAVRVLITAQEVLVDPARYPTRRIGERSRRFRPLGLGYANLGALLMALGHPYDSEEGRAWAAALTALMHGAAMCRSAEMAAALGPYEGFGANREGHLKVAGMHRAAGRLLGAPTGARGNLAEVVGAAQQGLERAVALGQEHGYRNSQHTVLAPTGTIGFLMGVETTGCEPVYLLRVDKALVGGGWLTLRAQAFTRGLAMLGYGPEQVKAIATHVGERGTAEGAPGLRPEHLAVFDTADRPAEATRAIDPLGHVRMLGAVQPFLSGGISKTVNLPHQATVEDIEEVLLSAHRLGVKAVAVYRDGSKRTQPLGAKAAQGARRPVRRRLPDDRASITHRFSVGGQKGYLTIGMYEDGTPGEVFVKMAKQGTTVSGLMDSWAIAVSMALQHGVDLAQVVSKFTAMSFAPQGMTGNRQIPMASSVMDYLVRYLASRFLSPEEQEAVGVRVLEASGEAEPPRPGARGNGGLNGRADAAVLAELMAPTGETCRNCGSSELVRSGTCTTCRACGSTGGCG